MRLRAFKFVVATPLCASAASLRGVKPKLFV